jgi:hypothetical protein
MDNLISTPDPNTSDYAPNSFLGTDADGNQWSTDSNGAPYLSGRQTTDPEDANWNWAVPNNSEVGYGPGGDASSTAFSLGNVASGISATAAAAAAAVPATVNAIRNAKTAIAAVNTPTLTQQWLQTPLQTQVFWLLGGAVILILAMKGKL